ncbi:hypothetical protein ACU610_23855 [Geodermatophilus sp. URMC 61]|uniref:hypothetical protein n=1 Tax=Geodermatophilus sp. URMC 61 TaxID=3423411 RepID=UPI00406C67E3
MAASSSVAGHRSTPAAVSSPVGLPAAWLPARPGRNRVRHAARQSGHHSSTATGGVLPIGARATGGAEVSHPIG